MANAYLATSDEDLVRDRDLMKTMVSQYDQLIDVSKLIGRTGETQDQRMKAARQRLALRRERGEVQRMLNEIEVAMKSRGLMKEEA